MDELRASLVAQKKETDELQVGLVAQRKEMEAGFFAQKKELKTEYQRQVDEMYFFDYRCCMKKNGIMHGIPSLPSDDEDAIPGYPLCWDIFFLICSSPLWFSLFPVCGATNFVKTIFTFIYKCYIPLLFFYPLFLFTNNTA